MEEAPHSQENSDRSCSPIVVKRKNTSVRPKVKPASAPPTQPAATNAGPHPFVATVCKSPTKPPPRGMSTSLRATTSSMSSQPEQPLAIATSTNSISRSSRQNSMILCSPQKRGSRRQKAFVVVDYGVTAEQGTRKTMEDQHTLLSDGIPFFGVYDGHGGTQCAEYLRDHLHGLILGHSEVKTNPTKAITDGIVEADRAFLERSESETNESGSVCAVALILDDMLYVGNVGDCEAVLCRNAKPIVLTVKHNIQNNPAEAERVREVGGKVFHNRVGHPKFNPSVVSLAVTRAIGDAGFKLQEYTDGKPSGVIAVPDTTATRLRSDDEFLVIGCDGLWDVMTYEEVVSFCHKRLHEGCAAQSIAEELAQTALMKGSTDNVTAMLVQLNRREGPQSISEFVAEAAVSTSTRNLSEEP